MSSRDPRRARRRWTCTTCGATDLSIEPGRALTAHYLAHHTEPPPL